ncbi:helix-turn-helix domain-containing protein [Aquibium carbonis]
MASKRGYRMLRIRRCFIAGAAGHRGSFWLPSLRRRPHRSRAPSDRTRWIRPVIKAAELLGVARTTLWEKMTELGSRIDSVFTRALEVAPFCMTARSLQLRAHPILPRSTIATLVATNVSSSYLLTAACPR